MGWFGEKKSLKNEIETLLDDYISLVKSCNQAFTDTMNEYFKKGSLSESFMNLERQTHIYESACDDKRRDIEHMMYAKGLIPQSRGDVLGCIEAIDKLPNAMETIVQIIYTENLTVYERYVDTFQALCQVNAAASSEAIALFHAFLNNLKNIPEQVQEIDRLESKSDKIEQGLIHDFFRDDALPDLYKILYRDLVLAIGSISDRAENFSDRVNVLSVKRLF